jgi:hypothetical protein
MVSIALLTTRVGDQSNRKKYAMRRLSGYAVPGGGGKGNGEWQLICLRGACNAPLRCWRSQVGYASRTFWGLCYPKLFEKGMQCLPYPYPYHYHYHYPDYLILTNSLSSVEKWQIPGVKLSQSFDCSTFAPFGVR